MERKRRLARARRAFLAKNYELSLRLFSDLLMEDDNDSAARIGVLLSDIASENEEQAQKLFEYYQILKAQKFKGIEENIINIIKVLDKNTDNFAVLVNDFEQAKLSDIDGILYDDFKRLVRDNDFRKIFDATYNTKIVFTNRGDFVEFLNLLVENELAHLSLQYIETLDRETIYDSRIQEVLKKALEKVSQCK